MMQKVRSIRPNIVAFIYLCVIGLLPFHAFLTTWVGSSIGAIDVWRIWKELAIVVTVPFVALFVWRQPGYRAWLKESWLPRLIACYIVLTLGLGLVALQADRVNTESLIYGLLANLRYVGFFLLMFFVAAQSVFLRKYIAKIVLGVGIFIVAFGILQITALPYDFLKHFGYGPDTIPAYHTVDNKVDYQRVQSTLRGPNPLGAYLVVIGTLIVAYWRARLPKMSWRLMAYGAFLAIVLLFSYSRSAYLGLMASTLAVLAITAKPRHRRYMMLGSVFVVGMVIGLFFSLRHNPTVQNTLFHTDSASRSMQSSNDARAVAIKNGVSDVLREPLGRGPGTAGPASTRNVHPARIAENYYLQLGQEVGWAGVMLFLAINVYIARLLWTQRKNVLALALLASFIGLAIVNLVSHAWADDTLGLLWWGLAGAVLGPAILKQGTKKHVQT
jgi:hypothetical protein